MRKQHFLWAYPVSEGTESAFEERGVARKVGQDGKYVQQR